MLRPTAPPLCLDPPAGLLLAALAHAQAPARRPAGQPPAGPGRGRRAAGRQARTAEEQNDLKVRTLEERVSDLKEKIFRTKARLMNLQEMVIGGDITTGAKAVLVHRNEMGSSFYLESVTYALDGAPIYTKVDLDGDLDKREEFEIFNGRIVPGNHQLAVQMVFRGHGFGLFSYLEGYRFKVQSSYTFNAEPGKAITVKVVGLREGRAHRRAQGSPRHQVRAGDPEGGARRPRRPGPARGRRHEVRRGHPGVAAAALALAAALLAPGPAPAPRWTTPSRRPRRVEARLAQVEQTYGRPDESAAARARRQFSDGETQFLLGDWLHASVLLYDALDEPGVPGRRRRPARAALPRRRAAQPGGLRRRAGAYDELLPPRGPRPAAGGADRGARLPHQAEAARRGRAAARRGPAPAGGRPLGRARLPGRQGRLLPHRPAPRRAAGAGAWSAFGAVAAAVPPGRHLLPGRAAGGGRRPAGRRRAVRELPRAAGRTTRSRSRSASSASWPPAGSTPPRRSSSSRWTGTSSSPTPRRASTRRSTRWPGATCAAATTSRRSAPPP